MDINFQDESEVQLGEFGEELLQFQSGYSNQESQSNVLDPYQDFNSAPNEKQIEQIWTCQMKEYHTLMDTKIDTKNIPKTFGNYFRKYCDKLKQNNPDYKLPYGINVFMSKKASGKQSTYGLEDFRKLCLSSQEAKELFYYYTTNCLYLDLLHSNRVKDPLEYINFIEQYAAGSQTPEKFISSRKFTQIQKKSITKIQRKKATIQQ